MSGSVRPIEPGDVEGFRQALDQVAREKKFLLFEEAPPLDRMRTFVEANISSDNPQWVAIVDDIVVGWCDVLRETGRPMRGHCGTLGMGLIAKHRGKGLGRRLLVEVLAAAASVGIKRVELTARASNSTAIALYRAVGFLDEGYRHKAYCVDGAYEDGVSMAYLMPDLRTVDAG